MTADRLAAELAALRERQRRRQAQAMLAEQLRKNPPVANTSSTGNPKFYGEGREYRRQKPYVPPPPTLYPIKILFRVQRGDNYEFYVGGDRPKPLKIDTFPVTAFQIELSSGTQPTGDANLTNTGTGLGDWLATIVAYEDEKWAVYQYQGSGTGLRTRRKVGESPCPLQCYGWGFCSSNGVPGMISVERIPPYNTVNQFWLLSSAYSDNEVTNQTYSSSVGPFIPPNTDFTIDRYFGGSLPYFEGTPPTPTKETVTVNNGFQGGYYYQGPGASIPNPPAFKSFQQTSDWEFKANFLDLMPDNKKRGLYEVFGSYQEGQLTYTNFGSFADPLSDSNSGEFQPDGDGVRWTRTFPQEEVLGRWNISFAYPVPQYSLDYGFKAYSAKADLNSVQTFENVFTVKGNRPADTVIITGGSASIASNETSKTGTRLTAIAWPLTPGYTLGIATIEFSAQIFNTALLGEVPEYSLEGIDQLEVLDKRQFPSLNIFPDARVSGKEGGFWRDFADGFYWNGQAITQDGNWGLQPSYANVIELKADGDLSTVEVYETYQDDPGKDIFSVRTTVKYAAQKGQMAVGQWQLNAVLKSDPVDQYDVKYKYFQAFPLRVEANDDLNNTLAYQKFSESFYPLDRSW